ncbi:MAG: hypothetical protein PHC88_04755 [Terrimicrobiaceae bacterium]|nr:hypothetical protein [Terrimicrobiaceae bacterium]
MSDPAPLPAATAAAVTTAATDVMSALAAILQSSVSPDALAAQNLLLRRLSTEGDVFSSRIPVPRNITEVGGYLNLLDTLGETVMREQALASALGVAGPNPTPGFSPSAPVLYDVQRANDRPAGAAQPTIPVQFSIRNDFAAAFDAALKTIHDAGCALPILGSPHPLPPAGPGATPPADLLPFLGRALDLMPTAALVDPDADPLALAQATGTTKLEVVARQLNAAAPNAASVTAQSWDAYKCDANACATVTASRTYLPLTPILNAAGWYQKAPPVPAKLSQPGAWNHWINVTGLIPNVSTFGDEIRQRVTPGELAASSLRDAVTWVWDGQGFKAA